MRAASEKVRTFAGVTVRHMQHFNFPGPAWHDLSGPSDTLSIVLQEYGGRCEARYRMHQPPSLDQQRSNHISFVPAAMTAWAYSDNIASVRELRLSFDAEGVQRHLDPDTRLARLQIPQLMFQEPRVVQAAKLFARELDAADENNALFGEGLTIALLSACFRRGETKERHGLSAWQLLRSTEYIQDRLGSAVTLVELAQQAGMSTSQFARLFRNSTGMPPHRFQLQARIKRAQELMLHSNETLSSIALTVGYVDQSHFTRHFRNATGTTPHAWRRDRRR